MIHEFQRRKMRFQKYSLTPFFKTGALKLLPILLMIPPLEALSGDHICSRIENYTLTSMVPYTYSATVRTYGWCFSLPPRCTKIRYETRTKHNLNAVNKTRIIYECCKGYTAEKDKSSDIEDEICLPLCKNCDREFCVSPGKCRCPPGVYKDDCDYDCPHGYWGDNCLLLCDCLYNVSCHTKNGTCHCPPGYKGLRCEEKCPEGRWGPACVNYCTCNESFVGCHHETGECLKIEITTTAISTTVTHLDVTSDVQSTELFATSESKDQDVTESVITSAITESLIKVESSSVDNVTVPMDHSEITTENQESNTSSTFRPVVVLVSAPERRNADKSYSKIALKDVYLGHYRDRDNMEIDSRINYIKTFQKEDMPATIPLEIGMIAVAAIVALGLTAAAVITVVHMRLKAVRCEAMRPSPYDQEKKPKNQERESGNAMKIASITGTALPQTPICTSPNFGTLLGIVDDSKAIIYANEPSNIDLRMLNNIHNCLQDNHYDKPPATLISLQTSFNSNTEHIYDEIPLCSPILSTNQDKVIS